MPVESVLLLVFMWHHLSKASLQTAQDALSKNLLVQNRAVTIVISWQSVVEIVVEISRNQ